MDGRRLACCARARQSCIKRPSRAARPTTRTTGPVDATFDPLTAMFTSGMSRRTRFGSEDELYFAADKHVLIVLSTLIVAAIAIAVVLPFVL